MVVLDASALLALLQNEPGGAVVRAALEDSAMSTVNLAEVIGAWARNGGSPSEIDAALGALPFIRVPLDEDLARSAGLLEPMTRSAGLSLGDRACLALARRLDVEALTTDRTWEKLAPSLGVKVTLIR